jgi:GNAT superfamily N-acetyltransferase
VLLVEEATSMPPQGFEGLSPKFDPIFEILGELDAAYRCGKEPIFGESVHLFLLGVALKHARQGVAHGLVASAIANSTRKGYSVAFAEATNQTSRHVFRKQGFVERSRRSYGEHRFHGQAVFASIAEQGGPVLMEKKLTQG